jgi:hypothetical protein
VRTCTECGQTKPLSEFGKQKMGRDGQRPDCKECARARARRYREREGVKERVAYNSRIRRLREFGLTPDDYRQMLANQDGRCAICRLPAEENRHGVLCIDHCAVTNQVRGLLCDSCNLGIGYFLDSPTYLRRAALYVENYSR